MPAPIVLSIGPVALALGSDDPAVHAYVQRRYGRYLEARQPGAILHIATGHPYDPVTACTLIWSDDVGTCRASSGALDLSFDFLQGEGTVTVTADPDGLPSAVDNAVRGVGARLLAAAGHLLVHGCGIVVNDGLAVFYGPSGVGKTTLARVAAAAGLPVAGDDLLVIDPAGGRGCGSPFWGDGADLPANQGWWPLTGFWRLDQADTPTAVPLTGARALAELLCQIPLPAHDAPMLLEAAARLSASVPHHRLAQPRPTIWRDVQEVAFG